MFVYLEVQLIFTQSNSPSSILFMNKFRKERNGAYFVKKKRKKKTSLNVVCIVNIK